MPDNPNHDLQERIKELTMLHRTARLLQNDRMDVSSVINEIVRMIPGAWQYPEITAARIHFQDLDIHNDNYQTSPWAQKTVFSTRNGDTGSIEVVYLDERAELSEGPFLSEERDLIDSLAEMLKSYFQHQQDDEALQSAHDRLEEEVKARTAELEKSNTALRLEIESHLTAQKKIVSYQNQLRRLASELALSEEKERREIASDLHDHIGQALAVMKIKIEQFSGDTIFHGQTRNLEYILNLIGQTIRYTRNLTFEISPPVLYELGLEAAIEWLGETFSSKHNLKIKVKHRGSFKNLSVEIKVLIYKSVRELLFNIVKHAKATKVKICLEAKKEIYTVQVEDDGVGFKMETGSVNNYGFGLFSIRERFTCLGGAMNVDSVLGQGTTVKLTIRQINGTKSRHRYDLYSNFSG